MLPSNLTVNSVLQKFSIEDYAKDGGKELFTKTHCVLNQIPIGFLKICNSNAIHHGMVKSSSPPSLASSSIEPITHLSV